MAIGCGSTKAVVQISSSGEGTTTIEATTMAMPITTMTAIAGADLTGTGNPHTTRAISGVDIATARQGRGRESFIARAAAPSNMRTLSG